jgi:hypothetical protein
MTDSQCPNCNVVLAKTPTRKTNCPSCKKPIYLKYAPGEDKSEKRLMTEKQAMKVDKAWGVRFSDNEAKNTALNCGVELAYLATLVHKKTSNPNDILYHGLQAYALTLTDWQRLSFINHVLGSLALKRGKKNDAKDFFKVSFASSVERYKESYQVLGKGALVINSKGTRSCESCISCHDKTFTFNESAALVYILLDNCQNLKQGISPCFNILYKVRD